MDTTQVTEKMAIIHKLNEIQIKISGAMGRIIADDWHSAYTPLWFAATDLKRLADYLTTPEEKLATTPKGVPK